LFEHNFSALKNWPKIVWVATRSWQPIKLKGKT